MSWKAPVVLWFLRPTSCFLPSHWLLSICLQAISCSLPCLPLTNQGLGQLFWSFHYLSICCCYPEPCSWSLSFQILSTTALVLKILQLFCQFWTFVSVTDPWTFSISIIKVSTLFSNKLDCFRFLVCFHPTFLLKLCSTHSSFAEALQFVFLAL